MPRLKTRYRGSVMQNNPSRRDKPHGLLWKIRVWFVTATIGVTVVVLLILWFSDWPSRQLKRLENYGISLTQRAHFAVKSINVEGRQYTDKDDIFKALDTVAGAPILTFDPKEAHERLSKLPWVAGVTIERRLPDTLYIRLTERQPMARWQHDNVTEVIDREGKVLTAASADKFPDLLLVAGDSAPAQTANLLTTLKEFPNIFARVKGAVRVGERRWNLHLQTGQLVRLPEHNMAEALNKLDGMIKEKNILDRAVTGIDLRLQDKVILEPGAESAPGSTEGTKP